MRYPVNDDFAIALSEHLYDLLADKSQPLPQALGQALRRLSYQGNRTAPATVETSSTDFPALSPATPALFGGRAIGLRLAAPERDTPGSYDTATLRLPGFPPEPDRFVGRTRVMTRASAALARKSRIPGVLLHGMPGGGKTACALELAYNHEHAFDRFVWYKAPDDGMDITGSLTDFALTLERYLPGFHMIDAVSTSDKLGAFLPGLTELMERRRLLIIIDNAESLLTDSGQWRDDRWSQVVIALTGHTGLGRLILTSRRVPSNLARMQAAPRSTGVLGSRSQTPLTWAAVIVRFHVEAVDALSADEALLLARDLPNLRKLSRGKVPGIEHHAARRLARRALELAQGHPKLLELADGQAAHPHQLARLVEAGDQAWREQGGLPDGFFSTDEATLSTEATAAAATDYWHVLTAWTRSAADTLAPGERDLFWFLCCLEEPDRRHSVIDALWAGLWSEPDRYDKPPDLNQALAAITNRALVAVADHELYAIHPGVASTGRALAMDSFQEAANTAAAAYWYYMYEQAAGKQGDGTLDTALEVRAALAAVPYLIRLEEWDEAAFLLERAFDRGPSRTNAAAALPAIRQITLHTPLNADVLAMILAEIAPAAAEEEMRAYLDAAADRGDYVKAAAVASRLADLCLGSGRLAEAFAFIDKMADYGRHADLGPWTQLGHEVRRLQALNAMGQAHQVLAEVWRLLPRLDALPAVAGPREAMSPHVVREILFAAGRTAATRFDRWDDALALSAAQQDSMRQRNAMPAEIARARFDDYAPLIDLGRDDEAFDLLLECRRVFLDARDAEMLAKVFGALAQLESHRGNGDAALHLERAEFRYSYLVGDATSIAVIYRNHAITLTRYAHRPSLSMTCHFAAALIGVLSGSGDVNGSLASAANALRHLGAYIVPPRDVTHLCARLAEIPDTDLPGLIAKLSPDPDTAEQALRDLIAQVKELAATPPVEASPDPA